MSLKLSVFLLHADVFFIPRLSFGSLTFETECPKTCGSGFSSTTSLFTPTFLQSLMFCGKRANAEQKHEQLEKSIFQFVENAAKAKIFGMTELAATAGAMAKSVKHRRG